MLIDLRVRPPYKSFVNLSVFGSRMNSEKRPANWVGPLAESAKARSMDLFLDELKGAGVRVAVAWGRALSDQVASTSNDDVASLVKQYSGTLLGLGGIAIPSAESIDESVSEVKRSISVLGLRGITLEPGFALSPTNGADDPNLMPIYETCQDLGGILGLTISVRAGHDITFSHPAAVDRVAAKFPRLRIVVGHSFWPWVAQACGVAYRHRNVYLLPDFYGVGCPGHLQWVEAANTLLSDKIVFGSAYPLAGVGELAAHYRKLPFAAGVLDKVMWRNAAELLGLAND